MWPRVAISVTPPRWPTPAWSTRSSVGPRPAPARSDHRLSASIVSADRTPENWRWRAGPVDAGPAVVFDMDGVLSDAVIRQHYIEGPGRRDWHAFFEACGDDPLIEEIERLLNLLDSDLRIVLLTGRPIRVQPQT